MSVRDKSGSIVIYCSPLALACLVSCCSDDQGGHADKPNATALIQSNTDGMSTGGASAQGPNASFPAKGYALAIGLARVDPIRYGGQWTGKCEGCEQDAEDMAKIAADQGFAVAVLKTQDATREIVKGKLSELASNLVPGDLLVVSYSGHGGLMPDHNGDEKMMDPEDTSDETWCLFDGEILDDEIYEEWMKFQEGVRILVFSDSCYSGTILKMKKEDFSGSRNAARIKELEAIWEAEKELPREERARALEHPDMKKAFEAYEDRRMRTESPSTRARPDVPGSAMATAETLHGIFIAKALPPDVAIDTYLDNTALYDEIGRAAAKEGADPVRASVLLIAGCEESQKSYDYGANGLFTMILKKVWGGGAFDGDYVKFHAEIKAAVLRIKPIQSPAFYKVGTPNAAFIAQKPYTVSSK